MTEVEKDDLLKFCPLLIGSEEVKPVLQGAGAFTVPVTHVCEKREMRRV